MRTFHELSTIEQKKAVSTIYNRLLENITTGHVKFTGELQKTIELAIQAASNAGRKVDTHIFIDKAIGKELEEISFMEARRANYPEHA